MSSLISRWKLTKQVGFCCQLLTSFSKTEVDQKVVNSILFRRKWRTATWQKFQILLSGMWITVICVCLCVCVSVHGFLGVTHCDLPFFSLTLSPYMKVLKGHSLPDCGSWPTAWSLKKARRTNTHNHTHTISDYFQVMTSLYVIFLDSDSFCVTGLTKDFYFPRRMQTD